jgi:hypothetical protein
MRSFIYPTFSWQPDLEKSAAIAAIGDVNIAAELSDNAIAYGQAKSHAVANLFG